MAFKGIAMDRKQVIERLWEDSGHGTRRKDIEAAYDAGASSSNAACGAWVTCAARLPGNGQFVLAFGPGLGNHVSGPEMDICTFDGDLWVEGGTELANQNQRFTHWMPMPAAPV